jgi:alpha 1,3-glucosidase
MTTMTTTAGAVSGELVGGPAPLNFQILMYTNGVARTRIVEKKPLHGARWQPDDIVLEDKLQPAQFRSLKAGDAGFPSGLTDSSDNTLVLEYGLPDAAHKNVLVVNSSPFKVELYQGGKAVVSANGRSMFHFEHHRAAPGTSADKKEAEVDVHGGKEIVDYGEDGLALYADGTKQEKEVAKAPEAGATVADDDGLWVEKFQTFTDSKPYGPSSVGMDISFPGSENVYGIPSHSSPMALKTTTGPNAEYDAPYRMYTLDVFEYELDNPMALYGTIPLMISHKPGSTVAAFWFNPSETFIDVSREGGNTDTHWVSESGIVDLMFVPGPTPEEMYEQYAALTGGTALPPLFGLAYQQCRWNYKDQKDVATVNAKFEEHNIPYDVLWLDIEHTDGKRYFTWDKHLFPEPREMIQNISDFGRKMVTIVDPHIKRDNEYRVHKIATEKGLYIKNKDGGDFDGWCWPGSSSYLDFTASNVREWWAEQFSLQNYEGSTLDLYTWNDMNEPSVFNGPEVSMQKDTKSLAGVEHREWHNLYGMYMHRATAEGHVKRCPDQNCRPFVLSRSFYAGSQRFGAIWTGDNKAEWSHLVVSMPMLLSLGLAGLTFTGADVGGFFGDPDAELMTRWYQTGAYQPFFRGHAHHDSKRREPYIFGEPHTGRLRSAIMTRYQLLPYWYTLFHEAERVGMPTMRPMWVEFPDDAATFKMETQYMVGSGIMVKPITGQGVSSTDVYFAGSETW